MFQTPRKSFLSRLMMRYFYSLLNLDYFYYYRRTPRLTPIMLSSPSSSHTSLLWNTSKTIPNPHAKVRPLTTKPSARRRDYQQAGVEVTSIIHSPSYHFTTALAHAPKVVAVGIANLTPSGINSKPTRSSS